MIGQIILNIYRIDGMVNSTIIETTIGFFRISGNGFFNVPDNTEKQYRIFNEVDESGQKVIEVRSSMEHTVIKLSNGDYIVHHIDTPFLTIETDHEIKMDKEFLDWYNSELQLLSNEKNFAIF